MAPSYVWDAHSVWLNQWREFVVRDYRFRSRYFTIQFRGEEVTQKPHIAASSLHVPGITDATDVHTINKQNNSNQPMKLQKKDLERRVKQWEAWAKIQTNKLTSQSCSELLPTSLQPLSQLYFFLLVLYKPITYLSSTLSAEIVKYQLSNSMRLCKNWITGGWSQHRRTYSTISCVNSATLSRQHYKQNWDSLNVQRAKRFCIKQWMCSHLYAFKYNQENCLLVGCNHSNCRPFLRNNSS